MSEMQYMQTVQAELEQNVTTLPFDPSLADEIFSMMVSMNRVAAQQYQGETYDHQTND